MELRKQTLTAEEMGEAFRARGNNYTSPGGAMPDCRPITRIDAKIRAVITDTKLEMAASNIQKCLDILNSPHPSRNDLLLSWEAAIFQLSSIFQDIILFELMHYGCFFFEWMQHAEREQILRKPYGQLKGDIRKELKQHARPLLRSLEKEEKKFADFTAMRNFPAHTGTLIPLNRLSSSDRTGFMGYEGADVLGSKLLDQAGFNKAEHVAPKYMVERLVDWYNRFVASIDAIRETALATAPFFDPSVKKVQAEKGLMFTMPLDTNFS